MSDTEPRTTAPSRLPDLSRAAVPGQLVALTPGQLQLRPTRRGKPPAHTLCISDDELRDELVPINTRFDVDEILSAAHEDLRATGRRVSIEYALIRDINDQAYRARLLADRLIVIGGTGWVHVKPIPLNPVKGSTWTASDPLVEKRFVQTLRDAGISATIRDTRGSDIDGACGQLAAEVVESDAHRTDREARVVRVEAIATQGP